MAAENDTPDIAPDAVHASVEPLRQFGSQFLPRIIIAEFPLEITGEKQFGSTCRLKTRPVRIKRIRHISAVNTEKAARVSGVCAFKPGK